VTFHIKNGLDDPEFVKFKNYYAKCEDDVKNKKIKKKEKAEEEIAGGAQSPPLEQQPPKPEPVDTEKKKNYYRTQMAPKNIWIIKPGENTNRGQGIQVAKEFNEIRDIIEDATNRIKRTCIL